ncbi:MAG: ABC transporter permease subunit [Dehalococcoidia bacterium]
MNRAILRRQLIDLRWHIFWYGIGIAIYAAIMVLLFPTFEGFLADVEYPEEFLQFFGSVGDLSDPRYFLQTEYFSFVPVILLIYAVMAGTGLFAGDEGRGTLETTLAQPISRGDLYRSRVAALLAGLLLICALNVLGWVASVPFVDLENLGLATLTWASFAVVPLVAAFAGLSVLVAAIAPSRGTAGGLMAVVAITSYLLASFANTIEAIEWTKWITPYFYADTAQVLSDGLIWWHQALLVAVALVAFGLGGVAFNGREIGAGTWQPRAIARGWRFG